MTFTQEILVLLLVFFLVAVVLSLLISRSEERKRQKRMRLYYEDDIRALENKARAIKRLADHHLRQDKSRRRCDEAYLVVPVEHMLKIWDISDRIENG